MEYILFDTLEVELGGRLPFEAFQGRAAALVKEEYLDAGCPDIANSTLFLRSASGKGT
jgi:hypothetical protein